MGQLFRAAASIVMLLAAACSSDRAATPEEQAVLDTFEQYREALASRNGDAAVSVVTARTIEKYDDYRRLALEAPRADLEAKPLLDQAQVLLLRALLTREELEAMDGPDLFARAVSEGWVGDTAIASVRLEDVLVREDFASAKARDSAGPRFEFRREDGAWRLDLLSLIAATEPSIRSAVKGRGVSESQFLLELVSSVTGRQVGEELWLPLEQRRG